MIFPLSLTSRDPKILSACSVASWIEALTEFILESDLSIHYEATTLSGS